MLSLNTLNTSQVTRDGSRLHKTEYKWVLPEVTRIASHLLTRKRTASPECYRITTWCVRARIRLINARNNAIELEATLERSDREMKFMDAEFNLTLEDEFQNEIFGSSCHATLPGRQDARSPVRTSMSMEVDAPDWYSFLTHKLIVRVTIVVSGCCLVLNELSFTSDRHLSKLKEDFLSVFVDNIRPDVEIVCGNHTICAHKFMLCARSPYFRFALMSQTDPLIRFQFSTKDESFDALSVFIYYLYSDVMPQPLDPSTLALVHRTAIKHNVPSLVQICGQVIVSDINLDSACSVLIEWHRIDNNLKQIAIGFIRDHYAEIQHTQGWELLRSKSRLFSEVTSAVRVYRNPQERQEVLNYLI